MDIRSYLTGKGLKNAGADIRPGVDDAGAQYVTPRLGSGWLDYALRGRVYTGNIAAAGVVLPIYSNTTQQVGLWNPAGSGVNAVLISVTLTYVDTTGAAGGFVLGYLPNAPAQLATGAAITAFTETTPVNSLQTAGLGVTNKVKFGQGATLTVSAPSVRKHLGFNQLVLTAADATQNQWKADFTFDGDVIATPGSALFVAGNIATLVKVSGSVTWAEIDA